MLNNRKTLVTRTKSHEIDETHVSFLKSPSKLNDLNKNRSNDLPLINRRSSLTSSFRNNSFSMPKYSQSSFRRYTLPCPPSKNSMQFLMPRKSSFRRKSMEMKRENSTEIIEQRRKSACLQAQKDAKLTSSFTKTAQCAMLKTYEDQMFNQLQSLCPHKYLPRIPTPYFNSRTIKENGNLSNDSDFSSSSSMSSFASEFSLKEYPNAELNTKEHQIDKQIGSAMKILDFLSEFRTQLNQENQQNVDLGVHFTNSYKSSSDKLNKIVEKYERWHRRWLKMLDNNYF